METFVNAHYLGTAKLDINSMWPPEPLKTASRKLRRHRLKKLKNSFLKNRSRPIRIGVLVRPFDPRYKGAYPQDMTEIKIKNKIKDKSLKFVRSIHFEVIDGNHRFHVLVDLHLEDKEYKRWQYVNCDIYMCRSVSEYPTWRKYGHLCNQMDKIQFDDTIFDAMEEVKTTYKERLAQNSDLKHSKFVKEYIDDWRELTESFSKGGYGKTYLELVLKTCDWEQDSWDTIEKLYNPIEHKSEHEAPKDLKWLVKIKGMQESDYVQCLKKLMKAPKEYNVTHMIDELSHMQCKLTLNILSVEYLTVHLFLGSRHITQCLMKQAKVPDWESFIAHHKINNDNSWLTNAIELHRRSPGVKFSSKDATVPKLITTALDNRKTEANKETVFDDSKNIHVQSRGINIHFVQGDALEKLGHVMAKLKNISEQFCHRFLFQASH